VPAWQVWARCLNNIANRTRVTSSRAPAVSWLLQAIGFLFLPGSPIPQLDAYLLDVAGSCAEPWQCAAAACTGMTRVLLRRPLSAEYGGRGLLAYLREEASHFQLGRADKVSSTGPAIVSSNEGSVAAQVPTCSSAETTVTTPSRTIAPQRLLASAQFLACAVLHAQSAVPGFAHIDSELTAGAQLVLRTWPRADDLRLEQIDTAQKRGRIDEGRHRTVPLWRGVAAVLDGYVYVPPLSAPPIQGGSKTHSGFLPPISAESFAIQHPGAEVPITFEPGGSRLPPAVLLGATGADASDIDAAAEASAMTTYVSGIDDGMIDRDRCAADSTSTKPCSVAEWNGLVADGTPLSTLKWMFDSVSES
jgi:hypothetical protein